jgi:hypothetical protein
MRLSWGACAILAAIAAAPRIARGSVDVPLTRQEIAQRSFAECEVTPIDATSTWEDGRIVTYTRARVDRVLAGTAPGEVVIRTLGGTVGSVGQIAFGEAVLRPGEPVVLHLSTFHGATVITARANGERALDTPETTTSSQAAYCRTTTVDVPASFVPTTTKPCWTEGVPLVWKTMPIEYAINESASAEVSLPQIEAAMATAFEQWSGAACPGGGTTTLDVRFAAPTTARLSKSDRLNVVMFDDASWPHQDPASTLALTTVTYDVVTGEILDADLEINSANIKLTASGTPPATGYDLLSIVTHEAGHFVGFAHSPNVHATMYASYTPGSIAMRSLSTDDVAGVCAVYPPRAGCNTSGRADASAWILLGLVIPFSLRKKARRSARSCTDRRDA